MKTIVFDLETTNFAPDWGIILCGSYMEYPNGEVKTVSIGDKRYRGRTLSDDSRVVGELIKVLADASLICAHNGAKFDRPFINARALHWGIDILDPRGTFIDPVWLARKHFSLKYNSLDNLASFLGCKNKKTVVDGPTWVAAGIDRNAEAMAYVVEHCEKDVLVLRDLLGFLENAKVMPSKIMKLFDSWGSAR